jgi:uncharacterized protein (TIGR02246 family)
MKLASRFILCLLLVLPGAGHSMSITPNPAGLIESFVAAWNTHNPVAFGHLMAEDADWVTASGERLKGKSRIQAFLADEHASWAKQTTMKSISSQVRMLDDKTATVMFEWEITTPAVGSEAPSVARGNNLFVAVKSGDWLIVAGQVARAKPR